MIQTYLARLEAHVGHGLGATIIRALAGAGAVQAAGMLATFFVGILLARGLGVAGYGEYGIAFAIIALLSVPGEFGLPRLVLRETAAAAAQENDSLQHTVVHWATRRALFASLVAILLVLAGIPLFLRSSPSAVTFALLIGLALVPVGALVAIRSNALMGRHEVVRGQAPTLLIRPLLFSLLLLLLFHFNADAGAPEAMALNVLTALAALLLVDRWFRSRLPRGSSQKSVPNGSDWTASSLSMALMDGFRVLQGQIGVLLLGFLVGADQAGLFRVAMAVALAVSVPMTLLETVLSPIFARLFAALELGRFQHLATRAAQTSLITMSCLLLPTVIWGRQLIELIFGSEFVPAYPALVVLCIGQIMSAAFGMNASILMMTGHERRLARAVIFGVIANIILLIVLTPMWGAVGAAVAAVSYIIMWNFIGWRDARRLLGVDSSFLGTSLNSPRGSS